MTRFIIGLLLGLLIGIGGTAAFLITAGGGDYLVVSSPRVRELETSLKNVEQDRQWLRSRLGEANEAMAKLESRFEGLAARFESLSAGAHQGAGAAEPRPTPAATPMPDPAGEEGSQDGSIAPTPSPLAEDESAAEATPSGDAGAFAPDAAL